MAVGRISGPLLKSNLVRNGIDLAFETDLLYLDVNNSRVGINTSNPQYDLEVNGTIRADNLIADNVIVDSLTFENNNISSDTDIINLGTADNVVYQNKLVVNSIEINDNTIRVIDSNANLELDASGTGTIELLADTNVSGNLNVTGNVTTDGNITLGDSATDSIDFNAELASDLIPNINDTYSLGTPTKRWNAGYIQSVNASNITTDTLSVDGIDLQTRYGNIVYVAENGDNANTGTHPQDPVATIEKALQVVTAGDTVHIMPGVYQERLPLVVPAGVTVKGHSLRSVTVRPDSVDSEDVFHLNGETTVEDLTIQDFYYNSGTDVGYAFRFAPNFEVTSRSPYIRNVTVLTKGSVTNASDPRGFNQGDAGKGAYLDGSVATANSKEASVLFHAVTFITPGVDALTITNGVRVEWLNSFTYFANKGINAINGATGLKGAGQTAIRVSDLDGSFSAGETFTLSSVDGSTVLATGTIADKDTDGKFYINGNLTNLTERTLRLKKIIGFKGGAVLQTANKKFGSSSLFLDGVDSYISITANEDFGFAQGDFTLECWIDPDTVTGNQTIFDLRAGVAGDFTPHVFLDGSTLKYATADTTRIQGGTITTGSWQHIAVSRFNGWTRLYLNGTQVGVTYRDLTNYGDIKPTKIGGNYLGQNLFTGHIDDIRISNSSRYATGTYTVPTSQQVGDANTVFMTHFDGANGATELEEDVKERQTISFSGGATANYVELADFTDFGGEIRSIGSANIYGNYGAYGDGNGVIMYLIGHNFAYIGNGKEVTNDETTVIQANETTELNNAKVRYTSVDHRGDFRVGDSFYVDQETGQVVFNAATLDVVTPNGLTFTTGGDTTFVDGTKIETGDFRISGNTIETLTQDFDIDSATNIVNIQTNTNISGNLDVTGNVTVGGNVTIGDEDTDSININADVDSNITPNIDATYDLGSDTKRWKNVYANNFDNGNIKIEGNQIISTESNSDIEINASGTGNVVIDSDLQVTGNTAYDGAVTINSDVQITGQSTFDGDIVQTSGSININQSLTVADTLTVSGQADFENIQIAGNVVQTTESNSDLELSAAGTGKVIFPDSDLEIGGDLTVTGTTTFNNLAATGTITTDTLVANTATINGQANFEDIEINDNYITTTQSNSNLELRAAGTGQILIPDNNVNITNDLNVDGTITFNNSSGNFLTTDRLTVNDLLTINGQAQFEDIEINDNYITTTLSNSDLELRTSGTGQIVLQEDVTITGNLTVDGTTTFTGSVTGTTATIDNLIINNNMTIQGQINFDNIEINDNYITTTESNSDLELRANGTGQVIVPDNNVEITNDLNVLGTTTVQDITGTNITTDILNVNDTLTVDGKADFDDIVIQGNTIQTTQSNSDLELSASGTGQVVIPNNDVVINQNLTVLGDISASGLQSQGRVTANSFFTGDLLIDDNFITTTLSNSDLELRANGTGSIVIDDYSFNNNIMSTTGTMVISPASGTLEIDSTDSIILPNGDTSQRNATPQTGMIRYNNQTNNFEGYNGNWVNLDEGVVDSDGDTKITAELTPGANDDVIRFYNAGVLTADLTATRFSTTKLIVDDLEFEDNTIKTITTNSDLQLSGNGTGGVVIDNFQIKDSTILNTVTDNVTVFDSNANGYFKFAGTKGVVIPVGDNLNRPAFVNSETGMLRYNTADERVEIFDGTNWTSVAGSASGISRNDAEAIALEYVLVLG